MALTYYAGTEGNFINLNVPNGETSALKTYSISIPAGTYNVTVPSRVRSVRIGSIELTTSGVVNLSSAQTSSSVEINYLPVAWTSRSVPLSTTQRFIKFGNGIFVGVGRGGWVYTSTDGLTWTTRSANIEGVGASVYGAVEFGNGVFVAAGGQRDPGAGVRISTSTDGINWTTRTSGTSTSEAIAITFNGSVFAIATYESPQNPRVQTSSNDGVNWTVRSVAMSSNASISSIGSSKETGVIVIGGSAGQMASSANNGISWTTRTSGFGTSGINGIEYGNGIWVAVGNAGNITTSVNAITWTARTSGLSTSDTISNLTFRNGYFLAGTSLNGSVIISTNGINWEFASSNSNSAVQAIEYGNAKWILAVGSNEAHSSNYTNPINTTVQLEYKGIGA